MAFCNKLGPLLRRGVSQPNGAQGHISSMLNSLRQISSTTPNTPKPKTTKIGIVIRSFETPTMEKDLWGLPNGTKKIALPESRTLFTVLRSPHIDKKSREQFAMHIKKQYLVIHTESSELRKKFFWLKRQRIFGAQYELKISCRRCEDIYAPLCYAWV